MIAVAAIIGSFWFFGDSVDSPKPDSPVAKSREPEAPVAPVVAPPSPETSPITSEPSPAPAKKFSVAAEAPKLEQVREEVKRDPHSPPASTMEFARNLGHRLDEAMKTPESAAAFLPELEGCVSGRDVQVQSVRATCLAAVRRMGLKVPSLRARTDAIFRSADPEIVKLVP
jgi:hypothetical protein